LSKAKKICAETTFIFGEVIAISGKEIPKVQCPFIYPCILNPYRVGPVPIPAWCQYCTFYSTPRIEDELRMLEEARKELQKRLVVVENRLKELKKKNKKHV